MAVNFDLFAKYELPLPQPSYTHKSDKRVVTSVSVIEPKNMASLPEELMIIMEEAFELGVPVQVQFEIIPIVEMGVTINDPLFPNAPGVYMYHCSIESVKARIKPGTKEFIGKEEANLNHVINGTEESEEAEQRAKARMAKEKEQSEANRFTGLEIE